MRCARWRSTRSWMRPDEEPRWNELMRERHYLGFRNFCGKRLRQVAVHGERWLALIGWHAAALHCAARDRWIGWSSLQRRQRLFLVANQSRFLLLSEAGSSPHLASRVLGLSLRQLPREWQRLHGSALLLAESFVDPARFAGTCYRWPPTGSRSACARNSFGTSVRGERDRAMARTSNSTPSSRRCSANSACGVGRAVQQLAARRGPANWPATWRRSHATRGSMLNVLRSIQRLACAASSTKSGASYWICSSRQRDALRADPPCVDRACAAPACPPSACSCRCCPAPLSRDARANFELGAVLHAQHRALGLQAPQRSWRCGARMFCGRSPPSRPPGRSGSSGTMTAASRPCDAAGIEAMGAAVCICAALDQPLRQA